MRRGWAVRLARRAAHLISRGSIGSIGILAVGCVLACSTKSSSASGSSNGVDDVRQACEARSAWTRATSAVCWKCLGSAVAPPCPCNKDDFAAKCHDQEAARNDEPTCDGAAECVNHCPASDCACQ